MKITRKIEIDYGHTLPNHYSFCNQLHGHRGVIEVTVQGTVVSANGKSEEGMVMDFKFLKEILKEKIHDVLDHGFAVWKDDHEDLEFILKRNTKVLITDAPPTAEVLAKWAFFEIRKALPDTIKLVQVRWNETPNNWADYTIEDAMN